MMVTVMVMEVIVMEVIVVVVMVMEMMFKKINGIIGMYLKTQLRVKRIPLSHSLSLSLSL